MKTIPMIFNTEMVKALLDGRKTVTRRIVKDQSIVDNYSGLTISDRYNELNAGDFIGAVHESSTSNRVATLEILGISIAKLQDITEAEARSEGCNGDYDPETGYSTSLTPVEHFRDVWNSIYSNWNENPYVWVIEFEVIHKNVDEVAGD